MKNLPVPRISSRLPCFFLSLKILLCVFLIVLTVRPLRAAEFSCPSGDVVCLIAAISQGNQNGQDNTISLQAGIYSLNAVNNDTSGPNALPSITGNITLLGSGIDDTIIERSAGSPISRIFEISPGGSLTLDGLTIRGGVFTGGGIFNRGTVNLVRSSLYGNGVFGLGGGIFNLGSLTITRSSVSGNATSAGAGGGIFNSGTMSIVSSTISQNAGFDTNPGGAGIMNTESGNIEITNSTLSDNQLVGDGGAGAAIANAGTMTIINSTIAGNTTNVDIAPGEGGGIFNTGSLTITNGTIVHNEAGKRGGGMGGSISNDGGTVDVVNTILALNTATTVAVPPFNPTAEGPDCFGPIISLGNNLIGDPTGCTISLQASDHTGDPGLGAFVDPSTPGSGHLSLLSDSAAIDAGNDAPCPATDQLGTPRNGPCDIGAVEFYPIVNDLMTVSNLSAAFDSTPLPGAPAGTFVITANFDNTSNETIFFPFSEVVTLALNREDAPLEDRPLLLNADGGPGKVGARMTPEDSLTNPFEPGTTRTFEFRIGLQKSEPFTFFVNMLGEPRTSSMIAN